MTCLLAIAPSSYHYHHARLGVDKYAGLRAEVAGAFADSKGRCGYRRIKAVLKTGVSEKSVRGIMAEEGLVAHVPKRRRYSSYEGETTPAPANLVDRDFTAERPNEKWLTDISEIKARDGKGVPFAAGRLLRWVDPQGYVWSCINGVGLSPYREGPFANRNSWEWKLARARRLESVAPAFPMCKTCKFLPVCGGGCAYRNESIHPTCLRSIFENNELRILKPVV